MTPAWRNKSYYRRKFNRAIFQVKEDILEGSIERSTLSTISKDEEHRRTSHHIYRRGCWKSSPPPWRRYCHHFAYCWLYNQKGVGGQWELGKHFVLFCFSANKGWTRSTSLSEYALSRVRRNESTTYRHCYITCGGGGIPTTDNQGREFPHGRLFVLL